MKEDSLELVEEKSATAVVSSSKITVVKSEEKLKGRIAEQPIELDDDDDEAEEKASMDVKEVEKSETHAVAKKEEGKEPEIIDLDEAEDAIVVVEEAKTTETLTTTSSPFASRKRKRMDEEPSTSFSSPKSESKPPLAGIFSKTKTAINTSTSSLVTGAERHEGPSTANPLRINPPDFELSECFANVEPQIIKKDPDLDLLYFKRMIKGRQLYDYLLNELPWYRVTYETRGTTIRTPRWTCVWGCDTTGAPASKYKIAPRPIPPVLSALLKHVSSLTSATYNFVLVNYYETGQDSISWHSDDESFLGPLPCIASLSLGSPRDFMMKHKSAKETKVEKWSLESGDMVVMRGTTQSRWLHSVPKRANAMGRMNLTFRKAMNVQGTNNYYRYNVYTGDVHRWKNGKMVVAK